MKFDINQLMILDGAMGTMLQQRGLQPGDNPELVNLTHPEWVRDIHAAYVQAGSQVVYANTFGANSRKLEGTGCTVNQVVEAAVRNARDAAQGKALVALDMGPVGELLEPLGTLSFEDAYDLFAEVARAGEAAGAELAVIETMTDLYEAKAALLAVKEQTSLPVFVTMSFDESGRTFTGCTVASMARTLEGLGADAIGLNCSLGPGQLLPALKELCAHTRLPVIAKPNAGLPDPVEGHYDLSPEDFANAMKDMVEAGASIVGGCCGTSPAYISALKKAVAGMRPGTRVYDEGSYLCTPTKPVALRGVHVIGERINPTGKKRFQQALLEDDLDYIVEVAVQQMDAGAEILDVNVGYPGVDEVQMLPRVVKKLQSAIDLPLQLDSTNAAALEAGLRVYNGKAAVNSVNGEEKSLSTVLPLVKKYGAAVVGLTLDEKGLPQTAQQRVDIARYILDRAMTMGIPRQDVWMDCLTLTVSAQQEQAQETLRAVEYVHREMHLQTVLGVSNISFGLPSRLLMTQTFLVQAIRSGLTLPIVNPNQAEVMGAIAACRVLSGQDAGCAGFVEKFAGQAPAKPAAQGSMTLGEAICRGLRGDAVQLAKAALAGGTGMELVEQHLIPALDKVGADYECGKAFLPQLLSAAQAAQGVFEVIKTAMAETGGSAKKHRVIIATVQGDIHDIGKNIVKTVMENYGYEMIDLGRDVPPETIVAAVQAQNVRLVGLSALMTTTLPAMEETVRQLKALPEPPHVMVGGAVVTEDYAKRIGADAYARDARAAVEAARELLG